MFTVKDAGHEDAKIWSKEYIDKIADFFIQEKNKKSGKE
jgi:hypothetical protein